MVSDLLPLLLPGTGAGKIAETGIVEAAFACWDSPICLLRVMGVIELAGAVLLLFAITHFVGATTSTAVWIGAGFTQLAHAQRLPAIGPARLLPVISSIAAELGRVGLIRDSEAGHSTSASAAETLSHPDESRVAARLVNEDDTGSASKICTPEVSFRE